jgi:hypothetical protein
MRQQAKNEAPANPETHGRPSLVGRGGDREIDPLGDEQRVAVWCVVGNHDAHPDACLRGPDGSYACRGCMEADPWTHLAGI